jgi:hypothetical protein
VSALGAGADAVAGRSVLGSATGAQSLACPGIFYDCKYWLVIKCSGLRLHTGGLLIT